LNALVDGAEAEPDAEPEFDAEPEAEAATVVPGGVDWVTPKVDWVTGV